MNLVPIHLVATNHMHSHFVMNQGLLYPVLPRSRMVLKSMGAATLGANTLRPHQQQRILSCTRPTASRTVPPKLAQFSGYLFWEGLVKPNKSLKTSNCRLSSMHWFGAYPSCSHQPDAQPFCSESSLTLSIPILSFQGRGWSWRAWGQRRWGQTRWGHTSSRGSLVAHDLQLYSRTVPPKLGFSISCVSLDKA